MATATPSRRHYHRELRRHFSQHPAKRRNFFSLQLSTYPNSTGDYYVYQSTENRLVTKGFPAPQDDSKNMGGFYGFETETMTRFLNGVKSDLRTHNLKFSFNDNFIDTALGQSLFDLRTSISGALS